jgi:hypothetical protein
MHSRAFVRVFRRAHDGFRRRNGKVGFFDAEIDIETLGVGAVLLDFDLSIRGGPLRFDASEVEDFLP